MKVSTHGALKWLAPLGLLLAVSTAANATMVSSSYTVDANNHDPGLVIQSAQASPNPFSYDLSAGQSQTFDLFRIWTNESSVNADDKNPKPISVTFQMTAPTDTTTSVNGSTVGESSLFGIFQDGKLTWDAPADIFFGDNNDGHMQISLSDAIFSNGVFGLANGDCFGALVTATLTMLADPTASNDVPEPGAFGLFALGLVAMLMLGLRRRRHSGNAELRAV